MNIRRILLLSFSICVAMLIFSQNSQSTVRVNQLFNFNWKFRAGEIQGASQVKFDDSNWRSLDLPHDFQFEQPWDKDAGGARGFKAMGEGWYRKSFHADAAWKGKKVLLDFEGIMLYGDVWVNGKKAGGTDYGYLGFETDISGIIRYDSVNVVAVYASTGDKGGSRWYTGGGLYRDVNLIVKENIGIARHGVFITTPLVTSQKATVNVQVEIEGFRNRENNLDISVRIFSPDGKLIGQTSAKAPERTKSATKEINLPPLDVTAPALWSCESPAMYTAIITTTLDGKVTDEISQKFGIRHIEFNKEKGFLLNGKKVFLKGIANHHDLGAVGVAAYETAIARQMDVLKKFGFNHIRTSHNPYSEAFLRLADEKGMLIVDELYDKWSNKDYWAGRKPWSLLWPENMTEWIKRDRNHPSVIMWSFGNELQMREDLAGYQTGDWGVTTYRMMNVLAKRYDPTRQTTVAMFPARAGGVGKTDKDFNVNILPPELATVTEVSSFNYRWYNYQDYLKHAPHMIIFQSEATTNELLAPFYGMDREKMVGLAYWGAIEYWGESNGWPKKGWNYAYFNHALEPFPQAYLIKSAFDENPLVHIGVVDKETEKIEWNEQTTGTANVSSHWNRETGKNYNIYTYTNADEVELFINNKSLGIQKNSSESDKRNNILWKNIPYSAGKIVAVARNNGKEVARHQLETTGKAVALKLETENPAWKANGMDLQYVKVYAIDSRGRKVPTATGETTFEVSGAARLIAVDNGDHSSDELFAGNKRQMYRGFALGVLRAGQVSGEVKIKVSVPGLKKAELKLQVGVVQK